MADRSDLFDGLKGIVQYSNRDSGAWSTMAAFDSESMALRYAGGCTNNASEDWPWEYRAVNLLGEVIPQEQAEGLHSPEGGDRG